MSYVKASLFNEQAVVERLVLTTDFEDPPDTHATCWIKLGAYHFSMEGVGVDVDDAKRDLADNFLGFCRAFHIEYDDDAFHNWFPKFDLDRELPF